MQYHLNGFRSGDPSVSEARDMASDDPSKVDVLIIGCGPAGLTLAAQLSAFPDISVRIAERKPGPLVLGQADGIACRSVEMFAAFNFAEKVIKEGYHVNEVSFWRPNPDAAGIHRADRIDDVAEDLSEMPHVILSQARIHDFYLETMRNAPRRLEPDYNRALVSLQRTDTDFPVTATFNCLDEDKTEVIQARYVVGCDGARSAVRTMMGYALKGQSARQLWGVIDVLPITDFPDIRLKVAIQSADQGSVLIIPREGGYMVRLYIELDVLQGDERAGDRAVTAEGLIEKARAILAPYSFEAKEIVWWSAYEIGQRVCDAFDDRPDGPDIPRIFIAGDACHTHSPKAGQGMNVSMADTFNLGWKLAAVLRGQSHPSLLRTYSQERCAKAKELIEFDRDMARLFSARPLSDADATLFQEYFKRHGRYTAGVETQYDPSILTGMPEHQDLARGLTVGKRFHSAPVTRLSDAKPVQLGHEFKADGRWRIILFAPSEDDGGPDLAVSNCCAALGAQSGLVAVFTPSHADRDSVFDVRAVFQQNHRDMMLDHMPKLLLPTKGHLALTDYEKIYCAPHKDDDIFDRRGIDRGKGAMVVIRPDQYVSLVLPLEATDALMRHFEAFMLRPKR